MECDEKNRVDAQPLQGQADPVHRARLPEDLRVWLLLELHGADYGSIERDGDEFRQPQAVSELHSPCIVLSADAQYPQHSHAMLCRLLGTGGRVHFPGLHGE